MIVSIIIFLAVLSLLVLVHEFGHFIMARRAGVMVEEFGFGLPPRLIGKKIGETIYSINWLPFGGFVRLHGETDDEAVTNPKRSFLGKGKKARISIVVAGVIMNFLLAIVCFSIVYSFLGILRETGKVVVVDIAPESPAITSGIKVGDQIVSVDGKEVKTSGDVTSLVTSKSGSHDLLLLSSGVEKKIKVGTKQDEKTGKYYMGLILTSQETYYPPVILRPFYGAYYGIIDSYNTTKTIVFGLFGVAREATQGKIAEGTVGPVGLFAILDFIIKQGILPTINFVGIISINLAVINILPLPALDGGRLFFILIEGAGKRVNPKVENAIHMAGFVILLILLLLITTHDIQGVVKAGGILNFVNSLMK